MFTPVSQRNTKGHRKFFLVPEPIKKTCPKGLLFEEANNSNVTILTVNLTTIEASSWKDIYIFHSL